MRWVDELKPENNLFALFVSRSGQGKSTAAASFPKTQFMDIDGRIRGLVNNLHLFKNRISFEQFLPPKGWDEIYTYLDEFRNSCILQYRQFDTVVCDSMTALCHLFLQESINIQHGRLIKDEKDKNSKGLRMPGPNDYNYEAQGIYQTFSILRSLSQYINVIATAHVVPRFDKPALRDSKGEIQYATDGSEIKDQYKDMEEIGETLSIRLKVEQNTLIFFNEVYRFDKESTVKGEKFFVNFSGDLARSSLGLTGKHDITGKNFYEFWKSEVAKLGKPKAA